MEERYRQSLLYDFYGELLNEHQKAVFSAAIFDDMSYSELAEEFGCSRQAAFDLVRRINSKLESYETKLGLVSRFSSAREKNKEVEEKLLEICESLEEIDKEINKDFKKKINYKLDELKKLSNEVFEKF